MLEYILPRHLQIIYEINALFLKVNALQHISADLKYNLLSWESGACMYLVSKVYMWFWILTMQCIPSSKVRMKVLIKMLNIFSGSNRKVARRRRQNAADVISGRRTWEAHQHVTFVHCWFSCNQWSGCFALWTSQNNSVSMISWCLIFEC